MYHQAISMQVSIDDSIMQGMVMGKVFKDNTERVNSLDFHRTEDLLVTSSDDDTLHIYNSATGTLKDTVLCKKYGCQHVAFTHHTASILHASNKGTDNALRYLSIHDTRYIRFFTGHVGRVTALEMCPKTDVFMSAAQDKTVRLWDLRDSACQGVLTTPGQPCANFDEQGLVFAVAVESGVIKLYDVRGYDKGPFDTFQVAELVNSPLVFSDLKFSNDGKMLAAVCEGRIYIMDAFTGQMTNKFLNGVPEAGTPMEATFSHDGNYIISGCEDRCIRVWSVRSGIEVACWAPHAGPPRCLKWAPRRLMVASACTAVALWVPSVTTLQHLYQTPGSTLAPVQPSTVANPVVGNPMMQMVG